MDWPFVSSSRCLIACDANLWWRVVMCFQEWLDVNNFQTYGTCYSKWRRKDFHWKQKLRFLEMVIRNMVVAHEWLIKFQNVIVDNLQFLNCVELESFWRIPLSFRHNWIVKMAYVSIRASQAAWLHFFHKWITYTYKNF